MYLDVIRSKEREAVTVHMQCGEIRRAVGRHKTAAVVGDILCLEGQPTATQPCRIVMDNM